MRSRFGCDPSLLVAQGRQPTRALPHVCSTAGHLLAGEVLRFLVGHEQQPLRGAELAYCLQTHRTWRMPMPHNPHCNLDHAAWPCQRLADGPGALTLRHLFQQLAQGTSASDASAKPPPVRGELPWISEVLCDGCGRATAVRRFGRIGSPVGQCVCGEPLTATVAGMHSMLPAADMADMADVPLAELGLPAGGAVAVLDGEDWHQFFVGPPANSGLGQLYADGSSRS